MKSREELIELTEEEGLSADFIIEFWNKLKNYGKPEWIDFREKEYKDRDDLKLLLMFS